MATPTARRTRGPRTAEERATDAARTAATAFENLPPSYFGDDFLKPIAVALRFLVSGPDDTGDRTRTVHALGGRLQKSAETFEPSLRTPNLIARRVDYLDAALQEARDGLLELERVLGVRVAALERQHRPLALVGDEEDDNA